MGLRRALGGECGGAPSNQEGLLVLGTGEVWTLGRSSCACRSLPSVTLGKRDGVGWGVDFVDGKTILKRKKKCL